MNSKTLSIKGMLIYMGILFAVGLIALSFFIKAQTRKAAIESSQSSASETISQFKTLRAYYSANVVKKVKGGSNLKISYNHQDEDKSIPLPATMIQDLSQQFSQNGNNTKLKLYSDYPFPIRKDRKLDSFAKDAIGFFRENPDEVFVRNETLDGVESIRYAIADKLVNQSCVDCHNSHAETPKNDWRLGDVRGVLEVINPIESQVAAGKLLATKLISLLLGAFVLASIGIYFWVNRSVLKPVRNSLDAINHVSGQLTSTSDSVFRSSTLLADSTSDQAASTEETSASLEEISSMTQSNTEHAQQAKEFASLARKSAEKGCSETEEMALAMAEIKSSGDSISDIIRTIDEIAFQTNILALNAAVEAARAGEAGAGFAVVADEVRTLARRSAEAADETTKKIEDSIKKSEHGVSISSAVADRLKEIVKNAEEVDTLVASIAGASEEQFQGVTQVTSAVNSIDQAIQSNASQSAELTKDSQGLNSQVDALQKAVRIFGQLVGHEMDTQKTNTQATVLRSPQPAPLINTRSDTFDSWDTEPSSSSENVNRVQDGSFN